jgi:hypothetical protein
MVNGQQTTCLSFRRKPESIWAVGQTFLSVLETLNDE